MYVQVEALTAQVSDLEEAITEATQQSTLATQQLQEVSVKLTPARVWALLLQSIVLMHGWRGSQHSLG